MAVLSYEFKQHPAPISVWKRGLVACNSMATNDYVSEPLLRSNFQVRDLALYLRLSRTERPKDERHQISRQRAVHFGSQYSIRRRSCS